MKIFISILLFLHLLYADDIVGIWQLDKENVAEKIDKVIANKFEAIVIERLINHSWQEIEFKKDGTFNLVAVEDITPNQVWKKTDNDVYMIENKKTKKILGKQIILSKSGKTLLWKNTFDKKGLNLFYTRSLNSKVRTEKEKEKTDLANMVFFDRVYRAKMISTNGFSTEEYNYYYIAFDKNYSLVSLVSDVENLSVSNLKDMKSLISEKEKYDKSIENSSLSIREKIDKQIKDKFPIQGYGVLGFDIKNKKIITTLFPIMVVMENYSDNKGAGVRTASKCKEIISMNKEHLKCNNGVEYFLYHNNALRNTTIHDRNDKADVADFDVAKERFDEKKKLDRAFEEAVKEMG